MESKPKTVACKSGCGKRIARSELPSHLKPNWVCAECAHANKAKRGKLPPETTAKASLATDTDSPSYIPSCPPSQSCSYSCHSSPGSWFWGLGSRKQLFPAVWRLWRRIARWISINAAERFSRSYLLSCSCSWETFRSHLFRRVA